MEPASVRVLPHAVTINAGPMHVLWTSSCALDIIKNCLQLGRMGIALSRPNCLLFNVIGFISSCLVHFPGIR